MEDQVDRVILGNHLEVFADGVSAGFVVGAMDDPAIREQMVFRSPRMISQLRNLIDLMRETAGLPEVTPAEPSADCPLCSGTGYFTDEEGNYLDCKVCS